MPRPESLHCIKNQQERQILGELRQRFLSLLNNLARVAEEPSGVVRKIRRHCAQHKVLVDITLALL